MENVEVVDLSNQKEVDKLVRLLRHTKNPSDKQIVREQIKSLVEKDLGKFYVVDVSKFPTLQTAEDIFRYIQTHLTSDFHWHR